MSLVLTGVAQWRARPMRTVDVGEVGDKLRSLINERDPVDEDIGILGANGELLAVVLTKDAYEFFLRKVEEEEDRQDLQTVKEFLGR
ncbi:MAG: hypothetical protein CVV05_18460 [Gammaproteobacteria bacterium HGW-Gammaproteobacteria-1]|nr:MAG: hypothetical protein CVV05_18460 [Gammaproteobacteria bacterium HGW-Gammaproteobacteria-1]